MRANTQTHTLHMYVCICATVHIIEYICNEFADLCARRVLTLRVTFTWHMRSVPNEPCPVAKGAYTLRFISFFPQPSQRIYYSTICAYPYAQLLPS